MLDAAPEGAQRLHRRVLQAGVNPEDRHSPKTRQA
jgi:hypothetical protein